MTAVPVAQRMTVRELLELPDPGDGRRIELIDGELVVSWPAAPHDQVQREILFALETWARAETGRGRPTMIGVGIDEHNWFAPDIAWFREERLAEIRDPQPYPRCDIAVEVRSPSTWRYDIGAKKSGYERSGVPELWLADTVAREVLVFRRSRPAAERFDIALELGVGDTLESPLLPGFALAVAEIYPE